MPMFASNSCIGLALILRSDSLCINFFLHRVSVVQLHSFVYKSSVVSVPFVEKTILPPLTCLGILVGNQFNLESSPD